MMAAATRRLRAVSLFSCESGNPELLNHGRLAQYLGLKRLRASDELLA